MNFLFAWRYFKSKKSTNAIQIIAWVTVTAMAVGTAALVIVLSIFNGFEGLVKTLYSSFYPDIRITSAHQKTFILDPATVQKLSAFTDIEALCLTAEANVHLQNGDFRANAVIKGVDDNYSKVGGVDDKMVNGKFNIGSNDNPALVLGVGIENALNLLSDRSISPVTAYLPKKGVKATDNPMESISIINLQPSGSFSIQQDFDNKYVITKLTVLQQMLGFKENEYSSAEIKLKSPQAEKKAILSLQQFLGKEFLVENRYQQNRSLFAVMQLEKWAIYGILSLILIIAAFNMIGTLTMLVIEKQQDIQILQAMGASKSFIQKIFLTEGILLAMLGSIIGIAIAFLFSYLQVTFKLIPLQGSFVIDYYPVTILPFDLMLIVLTVLLIAVIASWVPSVRAARQKISLRAQ